MSHPDRDMVAAIVEAVIDQMKVQASPSRRAPSQPATSSGASGPLFDDVDAAVAATAAAQKVWAGTPRATKERVITALRAAMHAHTEEFARMALQETGNAGPYVLKDLMIRKLPDKPGDRTLFGPTNPKSFPVQGFPFDRYSQQPWVDPMTKARLEFLRSAQPG